MAYADDEHGTGIEVFPEETWVENRFMLELVTPDMAAAYTRIANGSAQRELLAGRAPRQE